MQYSSTNVITEDKFDFVLSEVLFFAGVTMEKTAGYPRVSE